jgi:hypothetical protein
MSVLRLSMNVWGEVKTMSERRSDVEPKPVVLRKRHLNKEDRQSRISKQGPIHVRFGRFVDESAFSDVPGRWGDLPGDATSTSNIPPRLR